MPTLSDLVTIALMSRYRRAKIEGGTFFFTITLADRQIDRLRQAYKFTADHYPFETIAICILPDHLHAIWSLPAGDLNFPLRWGLIKSKFSRGLPRPELRSRSQTEKRDKGIWQRRYWEHAIRDDDDLSRHIDYIHYNPVKHEHVRKSRIGPTAVFIGT